MLHWEVPIYFGVLYNFLRKSPKNTIIGQKVAISQLSSTLTETTFFGQTFNSGEILPKTVLLLKMKLTELYLAFQVS